MNTETVPPIPSQWDHINDVISVLALASAGRWHWGENMDCKYVEVRIDMRDGGCIIKDRHGTRITPAALAKQPYGHGNIPWPMPLALVAIAANVDNAPTTTQAAHDVLAERRAIMFGDIVHQQVIAMRAAVVAAQIQGPAEGMRWISNTLFGPGHLPDIEAARQLGGAQALFDKEMAEHEAFRASHPAPTDSGPNHHNNDSAATVAALRTEVERLRADAERLDALESHPGWEVGMEYGEDSIRTVHSVSGGRNDREWTLIGSAPTLRAAIDAARSAK
ncbi:MAG: hypothetical protein KF686_03625 [Ramlibacter sp.]|nr:hypothetical protein [Ramlibacter sp.]